MQKPRFRLSTRRMMILIVVIAIVVAVVRQMLYRSTVYSVEYDESRFQQVRAGQTSKEVEALMGPPLRKVPYPDSGNVNWCYTAKRFGYSDYWKRCVFMKNDKVDHVSSMYWID